MSQVPVRSESFRFVIDSQALFWLRTVLRLVTKIWLQDPLVLYLASTLSPVFVTWFQNALTGNIMCGALTHFVSGLQNALHEQRTRNMLLFFNSFCCLVTKCVGVTKSVLKTG